MASYLLINGVISIATLLLVRFYPASLKYRYRIVCFAIALWLIPWPQLSYLLPVSYESNINWLIPQVEYTEGNLITTEESSFSILKNWRYLIYLSFMVGVLVLLKKLANHFKWQKRLTSSVVHSQPQEKFGKQSIFFSEAISSAIILGITSPQIWVASRLKSSPHLRAIIAHEQQHIASHDNLKLFTLMIIESLFW